MFRAFRQHHWMDGAAIGLSSLCIAHCLLFPLLIAALPLFASVLTLPEWFHKAMVVVALAASAAAILPTLAMHKRFEIAALAAVGLICLLLGAFAAMFVSLETELTVSGALILSAAHGLNWHRRNRNRFGQLDKDAIA